LGLTHWLRNPETKRITRSAKLKIPVFLQFVNQKLAIVEGIPPYGLKTNRRITQALLREAKPVIRRPSPLEETYKYAEVYREPSIASMAQIGQRFGISRARVCQVLKLLELDENIQKYLLSIKDAKEHNYFTERRLRQIAIMKDKNEQTKAFGELVRDMRFELNNKLD
jgi:hypothetical protein